MVEQQDAPKELGPEEARLGISLVAQDLFAISGPKALRIVLRLRKQRTTTDPEFGVTSLAVAEDLEVFELGVGQFDQGAPALPVEQFDLHPSRERFDDSTIETVPH